MIEYKIHKYHNYAIIDPIPQGKLASALFNELSYEKKGIEFMPNRMWGIVHFYNVKKGTFPWGLLERVKEIFLQYCEKVEHISFTVVPPPRQFSPYTNDVTLRPYQKDAVNALLRNYGGVLSIPTGGGKTIIALEFVKHVKLDVLVITTTLDIQKQWFKKSDGVGNIVILNYQSRLCAEMVPLADIVIFDESHHASCRSIFKLVQLAKTDAILIGLSATPWREDGEDMRLEAALGGVVYEVSRPQLIAGGYLSNAVVKYIDVKYEVEEYLSYADEYRKYIVENEPRNIIIANIALSEVAVNKKVLVLVNHIEHGEKLRDLLLLGDPLFLNGGVKDRNVDLAKTNIIIASSIFNEGVDLPALDVLILAGAGKSGIQLTQRVGRVLRTNVGKSQAMIYDFRDRGKYLQAHYKVRRRLLEEEFEVVDL